MAAHAKKSPSGADRWAVCTKSVEMEEGLPDKDSVHSIKGTEAHDLGERAINADVQPDVLEPDHHSASAVNHYYWYIKPYLNNPRYVVFTEIRVDLAEDCWGTADCIILDLETGQLIVVDYKNGYTIVEPTCLQAAIYGQAAIDSLGFLFPVPVTEIVTVIVQPNAPHPEGPIREHKYTAEELDTLILFDVLDPIEKINEGVTEFCATDKACMWCKAAGNCPALAEKALAGVRALFNDNGLLEVPTVDDAHALSIEQKAAVMEARGLFNTFIGAIENDIETTLMAGGEVPGYKVVAGRANRRFKGTDAEIRLFCGDTLKLKVGQYTKSTLLGPAPIEKLIDVKKRGGKKKLEEFLAHVEKPEGKPTVVPMADKRPALAGHFTEVVDPLG